MRLPAVAALVAVLVAPAPARASNHVRVYPLGDSITYGASFNAAAAGTSRLVNTPGGYRGFLQGLLAGRGITPELVGTRTDNPSPVQTATAQARHDGWPGWRVDQIHASLPTWLSRGVAPDVVVVHLGTNDIGQRYDPGTTYPTADRRVNYADAAQRATFVAHLTARLGTLVDGLQLSRPGVRIVVSTVVPIATQASTNAAHPATVEYAAAVRDLVAAERAGGERVALADVFARYVAVTPAGTFVVPGLLSHDNVHPTPQGYAVMADVYDDAVAEVLAL